MRCACAVLFTCLMAILIIPAPSRAGTMVGIESACPTPHNDCTAACGTSCTYWSCEDHTTVPVIINELPTSFIRAKPQCTERIETVNINQLPLPAAQQEQVVDRVTQLPLNFMANSYACVSHSKPGPPCTWITGLWGACSATCGGGTQTRSVTCSGAYCDPATKPATSQACNTQACSWIAGAWGSCSASCGGGTQTRTVSCGGSTCDLATRPPTSQACNTGYCSWATSDWGGCSATACGTTGTQTRSVWCSGAACDPALQPASSLSCSAAACPPPSNLACSLQIQHWVDLTSGGDSAAYGEFQLKTITLANGQSLTLYPIGSRSCHVSCFIPTLPQERTCNNGSMTGDPRYVYDQYFESTWDAGSPLMIHLDASAEMVEPLVFTNQLNGINFDLLGLNAQPKAHTPYRISWYRSPKYYFITLPNEKGEVNGIDELFGNNTAGPDGKFAKDGYYALAKYDGMSMSAVGLKKIGEPDGYITKEDPVLLKLRLWHDDNFNGKAEPEELRTPAELGIDLIDLHADESFMEVDKYGNQTTLKSVARTSDGRYHVMFDVWFAYWEMSQFEQLKAKMSQKTNRSH